jgi:hypothetical protein
MEEPLALSKKESSHKSVTEFLNVTLLMALSASLLLILVFGLTLVVRAKVHRRGSREPQLLQHMEDDHQSQDPSLLKGKTLSLSSPRSQVSA